MSYRAKSKAISIVPSRFTSRSSMLGKLVAINAALVVFFLLLLEGAVRVAVPEVQPLGEDARLFVEHRSGTSHGYAANAHGLSLAAEFITDQYGRRIVPGETAPARERTILFVGDSVSVGYGVKAESALPHVLSRRVHDHEVVNAAVTAYTASDYANVLAALLPQLRPEGVIVGLCLNDFDPGYQFVLPSQRRGHLHTATPAPSWLLYLTDHVFDFNAVLRRHSRLYVWLKAQAFDNSANVLRADRAFYVRPEAHGRIVEQLSRLRDLAQGYNAWMEIVVFPYEYQLRSGQEENLFPQHVIEAAASEAAISVYDLYRPLADSLRASGESSKSLYLFSDPEHFSAAGHDIVARLIHARIAHRLGQVTRASD